MELNSKSFARSPPTTESQAERPKDGAVRFVHRSTTVRLILDFLAAFADTVEPVTRRLSGRRRWIAQQSPSGELDFYRVDGNRLMSVGNSVGLDERTRRQIASKGAQLELRLPSESVMTTVIKVPQGGLEYIEQIIENRLDRLTPWKPEKVFYGYSVALKAGSDGQFEVSFAATPRDVATKSIAQLATLGLAPSRMRSAAEPVDRPLAIDLFRGRNDSSRHAQRRNVGIVAVTALLLSSVAYGASVYAVLDGDRQLANLDAKLASVRQKMVEGAGNSADRQRELKLIRAKTLDGTKLALIDRLAAALPDNTFLDEMDIQPGSVRIAGTSTEASALIEILQSKAGLSDARFSAPVTREADGRDRFDITATVAPAGVTSK